ncbi:MAG: M48 family metallopeptidase [Planctomycetaceae bacterium]|nr:M48 family metallopeptidase [Planctomycetaceae bacterium]
MSSIFYRLGKLAGPKVRTAKWAYLSATAPQAEVIEAEYAVGSEMAQLVRKQHAICPELTQQLAQLAEPLLSSLKNNLRSFLFAAIQASEPQAFCLPGGFVFISDTLVNRCSGNIDQLAFIMAHELAHVIQGHVMERMLASALVRTLLKGGHLRAAATGSVSRLGIQFLERAYSRENEFRADVFAARLVKAAGNDPAGAIDLFLRLQPLQDIRMLGDYFSTHPPFRERIANIKYVLSQ